MSSYLEQKLIYAAQRWVDISVEKALAINAGNNQEELNQVEQAKKEYLNTVKELVQDLNLTAKA